MIGPFMYQWLRGARGVAGLVVLAVFLSLAFSPVGTVHAASLSVTNCLDDGSAGSLRDVITNAAAGATITFATDCSTSNPITLTGGTLTLSKDVTIDGTGRQVVIDGNCATDVYSRCIGGGSTVFTIPGGIVTLRALTIQHGTNTFGGGGIDNEGGTLTVTNSTLAHNSGQTYGGAIYNFSGTLTVTNSTLSSNHAGQGGGILSVGGDVTVTNCTLTNNVAGHAGGIWSSDNRFTVTNSTLSGNFSGSRGGGIWNSGSTMTVTNSTLSGNSTYGVGGGGILNDGTLTVTNSTLANNTTTLGSGGGIYNAFGPATLINAIVANSSSGNDLSGTFGGSNNLIDDTSGTLTGSHNITGKPALLTPLGSYGGTTQTVALLPGSAALGGGDLTTCTTAPVSGSDQRGLPRPDAGTTACDIGAFESQGFTLAKTGGDNQSVTFTGAPIPFAPLTTTVTSKDSGVVVNGGTLTFVIVPGSGSATFGTAGTTGCTVSGDTLTASGCTVNAGGVATSPPFTGTVAGGFTVTASATPGDAPEATYSETVSKATPTTAVRSGTNPSIYGQSVTFTATVSGIAGITPTGTVQFSYTPSGGTSTNFGTPVTLDAMGNAIVNTSSLPAGSDTITATYSGDANYTPGAPGGVIQTVTKVGTTTTLAISPSPAAHGSPVTLAATVAPATATGLPAPAGTVTFADSGAPLATVALVGGTASFSTSGLTVGVHHLSATYTPASPGPYATSQGTQDVTITPAALVSIAVTPATATLKVGQQQQFTATGTYGDGSTANLTGAVAWSSDAPSIASVDTSGKGAGQSPGTAHLTATQGGISGQTTVMVSAPTPIGIAPAPQPASRPGGASAGNALSPIPVPGGR